MGKVVHPIGTLTGTVGEFDLDKSNLIILDLCYFCLSVIYLVSVVCQITQVIGTIEST
jgi:hypothetical protein